MSTFTNLLKDTLGIVRAVSYRTFVQRKWKPPQPMFNIMEVKEGTEDLFKEFLRRSLTLSLKYNTPLSLGPFLTNDRIFIYITHYASTKAYMQVMNGLLFHGQAFMRAKATLKTSWTYCNPSNTPDFPNIQEILMVGIQGSTDNFEAFMSRHSLEPVARVEKIKDVRGRSLGMYYLFKDPEEVQTKLKEFREEGGDFNTYQATKLPN
ncbi:hypothetical protein POV27_14465 [Aureisphaera galaxeae]|uniref:hypothetical protein n=1 Tax=Aureisphaera galaxeae TaxID=1538023 RepID=UPI002350AE17|nr:hypothetical protein [Aureisphaera galaxeae]MDC8005262.1 hypothetical protein [Aureisphaera galaxeae]